MRCVESASTHITEHWNEPQGVDLAFLQAGISGVGYF